MSTVRIALPVVALLTLWFDVANPLMPEIAARLPGDRADLAGITISYAFYVLAPLRWVLVLWLLIRTVRVRPLPLVPPGQALQVGFIVIAQVLLGLLSLVGVLMLWVDSRTSERAGGFVLHVVLPTAVVAFLIWRDRQAGREPTAARAPS